MMRSPRDLTRMHLSPIEQRRAAALFPPARMPGRGIEADEMIRGEAVDRAIVQQTGAVGVAAAIAVFPHLLRLAAAEIEQRAAEAVVAAQENLFAENDRVAGVDGEIGLPRDLK